ncbi:MFS efflux pump atnC like protein [Verticillium longisporum]|uniref:MFS efflux pump atnC like protein n=1 Tax=Verticillium longisporum TaxID=100787 RepID=A0A0G4L9X2_VERLO|nr:MFS efflux pump atnC like protein [Verticillium longisporum]CRK18772.1 hypothetical protein BN1723_011681 [Verticillium longisporum]
MNRYRGDADAEVEPLLEDDVGDFALFPDVEAEDEPWIASPSVASRGRARWQSGWTTWKTATSKLNVNRFRPDTPFAIVLLLATIKGILVASGVLLMTPMVRLMEDAICHVHYHKDISEPIDEKECKVDDVQSQLAYLGGIGALMASLVTLVIAFPYGVLADRMGRKPAFFLAYVGILLGFGWGPFVLSFPHFPSIWVLLLGHVFFLIGGGVPLAINNIYAMAADVSNEADRSTHFLYLSVGAVIAGLLAPLVSGFLLQTYGPWVPIRIVFCLSPVIFTAASLLPETLRVKLPDGDAIPEPTKPFVATVKDHVRTSLTELASAKVLLRNRSVLFCLLAPLTASTMFNSGSSTLSQYISKYFSWSLAQTSYILSPIALCHLLVLAALPRLSAHLLKPRRRLRLNDFTKDLLLTRASYGILAISAFLQAVSPSIVPFLLAIALGTLGSATPPLTRALITAFVEKEHTSRLYAICSIVETLGAFIGGPVLAWTFSAGMHMGGIMRGLPWLYVSFLYACATAAFMMVREPKHIKPPVQTESGEEGVDGMGYESAAEDEEDFAAR